MCGTPMVAESWLMSKYSMYIDEATRVAEQKALTERIAAFERDLQEGKVFA